jgi:hypothetical protein
MERTVWTLKNLDGLALARGFALEGSQSWEELLPVSRSEKRLGSNDITLPVAKATQPFIDRPHQGQLLHSICWWKK